MKNYQYLPAHDAYVGRHSNGMIAWIARRPLDWVNCYSEKRGKYDAVARFRSKQ